MATAVLMVNAMPASGSTVEIFDDGYDLAVRYTAASGEANQVRLSRGPETEIVIEDAGATIEPASSGGCTAVTEHRVTCERAGYVDAYGLGEPLTDVVVELADRNDALRVTAESASTIVAPRVNAFGGPGADRLMGGPQWDTLDGGGGRDRLLGRGDGDTLIDEDREPDVLDGGDDSGDWLRSAARRTGVSIDLRSGRSAEGDVLRGRLDLEGGRGPDSLAGDAADNSLVGGAGRDTLLGRGGDDHLAPGPGPDDVSCGTGHDEILGVVRSSDRLQADCEWLSFFGAGYEGDPQVPTRPLLDGRRLRYPAVCPLQDGPDGPRDGAYRRCRLTVILRQAERPHRLLGAFRTAERRWDGQLRTLRLTTLGRQALAAGHGDAIIELRRRGKTVKPQRLAWTLPIAPVRWADPVPIGSGY